MTAPAHRENPWLTGQAHAQAWMPTGAGEIGKATLPCRGARIPSR